MPHKEQIKAGGEPNEINELYANLAELTKLDFFRDPNLLYHPYNPDDLYQKNLDYSVHETMLKDDQVDAVLQIKKDLVIAGGFEISTPNDDEDMKAELEHLIFDSVQGGFEDIVEQILSSYEYGFSISEKVFTKTIDNRLALDKIKTRHPVSWKLFQGENGGVERYVQEQNSGDVEIDERALIHFINRPKFDNPYGRTDLRACYAPWIVTGKQFP